MIVILHLTVTVFFFSEKKNVSCCVVLGRVVKVLKKKAI